MGQSLSSRVEWSSMTTAQPDGSQANLIAKSLANEDLLHDLVRYVEHLVQQYPQEAKIEFKKPLQYFTSTLRPSSFANDKSFAVLAAVGKYGWLVWVLLLGGGSATPNP